MAEEQSAALRGAPMPAVGAPDLEALMAWDCDLSIPDDEYARMAAHPRLAAGLRALWESNLAAPAADRTLLGIFKDGGRYVCAMWAIYLHVCGGLSLQSLKALCAQSGLLSPGRARAVLLYMRYLGYVEPGRERVSPTIYYPTPRFRAAWTLHMRLAMEAACAIEPAARTVVERMDDPEVFACVVRTQGESLFNGSRTHDLDIPMFKVFINRHAGTFILSSLMTGGTDGDYPPRACVMPSATDLAARFQVSRIQVRRMFGEAEKLGLLVRRPDGAYRLDDAFRESVRLQHAQQLRHLMLSAARTARILSAASREQI